MVHPIYCIVITLSLPGYYCESCGITAHPEKVSTYTVCAFSAHGSSIVQAWQVHNLRLTTQCGEVTYDVTAPVSLPPCVGREWDVQIDT